MQTGWLAGVLGLSLLVPAPAAHSFCGFYVAKADSRLFNRASKVVLVRDGNRGVLTMANDYQGEPSEFAVVIPVPTFIEREQIHVGDRAITEHLDAYSAPRLVEYYDRNPCSESITVTARKREAGARRAAAQAPRDERAKALGVTIEAEYTVGEYDILILSAEQSSGLETWLRDEGYRIPEGASSVLGSYLKQGMRFFVARVNLGEQQRLGYSYLRPLQVAYESPKFMLPIRLGTLNADGPQELFIFALTRRGRVETTNYRTVRLPTGNELPVFVRNEFPDFYRAMFSEQVRREAMRAVFLEYAWDMGWCDPCAADPLSREELRQLGVFWLDEPPERSWWRIGPPPTPAGGVDVFVTRLHLRYDAQNFPEDLVFQATDDRTNFQGRYVLRHPWTGEASCSAADSYRIELARRQEHEAQMLASLTGWDIAAIRAKVPNLPERPVQPVPWWRRVWPEPEPATR
jgi:hypothetical protein